MNFLIADALAQGSQAGQPSLIGAMLPMILLLGIFYFLIIRPQTKKAKEHRQMVDALKKGDEIVTNGGLLGRITEVGENFVLVEMGEGVQLKVQKVAIATLMPKGTVKGSL